VSVTLKVKVIASSSRDSIAGWLDDALKVKVMAPPEKGKANKAVISLLADRLSIDSHAINIIGGHSSPNKTITIDGLTEAGIRATLTE